MQSMALPHTSRNVTAATNGSDCVILQVAWNKAASSFLEDGYTRALTEPMKSWVTSVIYTNYSTSSYTLSDGYPRMSTPIPTTTYTSTYTVSMRSRSFSTFMEPSPICNDYSSCGDCTLYGGNVQLVYWPVSTASGNPNSTIFPTMIRPVTAVEKGTTYTSPTVYLSYDIVFASNSCGNIGNSYSGAVLSLSPDAVSSVIGYPTPTGTKALNYADFNTPIAPSVWLRNARCADPVDCLPIIDYEFQPMLAVPEQVRALDPVWATCIPYLEGSFDPPRALTPVQALAGTISTSDPQTTSMPVAQASAPRSTIVPSTAAYSPSKSEVATTVSVPSASDDPASTLDPFPPNHPIAKSAASISIAFDDISPGRPQSGIASSAVKVPVSDGNELLSTVAQAVAGATVLDPGTSYSANSADSAALVTLGSQEYTVNAGGNLVNGSLTLLAGHKPMTISRQIVSVASSVVILGGGNAPLSTPDSYIKSEILFTIGSQTYTAVPQGIDLGSSKIPADGQASTISSQINSVGTQGAVIGADTVAFSALQPGQQSSYPITQATSAIIFGSLTLTANPLKGLFLAGQTLTSEGVVTISGTPVSLVRTVSALVIGSTTMKLIPATALPILTIGSQTLTSDPAGRYIIAGQTLTSGNAITISGTIISWASSTTALVVGFSLFDLVSKSALSAVTVDSYTLTSDSAVRYLVAGQTFTPGGVITFLGTRISLAASGTARLTGFDTTALALTTLSILTIGSQRITADAAGKYVIAGQTLMPGGGITVSGTPISLASSASYLVIGSSTEALSGVSSSSGLAGLILSAFGGPESTVTSAVGGNYTGSIFTGSSVKELQASLGTIVAALGLILVL